MAGHTFTRALPAGGSSVRLPARLPRKRLAVTLTATDAAGRQAVKRVHVFPVGWLPSETADLVAGALFAHGFVSECDREHVLRRRDWLCAQSFCPPPPLFGHVGEATLIPTG